MKLPALLLALLLGAAVLPALAQGTAPGKETYEDHCAACHRSNGEGLAAKFPALKQHPVVLGDATKVIGVVLFGEKGPRGQMPAWQDKLNDQEVAAVATYIRQAWGNQASPVSPEAVQARRSAGK